MPGSFGSAFLYFVAPRVILFREELSPRTLVEQVDFVSAPGTSPPGVHRRGGPYALLTGLALFSFDRAAARFRLESVHAGHTPGEVRDRTAFGFDSSAAVPETPPPAPDVLNILRGRVLDELAETYPTFADSLRGQIARAA